MNNSHFFIRLFEKQTRSVEIYDALIRKLSIKQGASILNGISELSCNTITEDNLKFFLHLTYAFISTHNATDISCILKVLKKIDKCYNSLNVKILLCRAYCDSNKLEEAESILRLIDDERSFHQIQCSILLAKGNVEEALDLYKNICFKNHVFPELFLHIVTAIPLTISNLECLQEFIRDLISKNLHYQHHKAINSYVRRLFENKSLDIAREISDMFSGNYINLFLQSDMLMEENKYQEIYDLLSSNIALLKSFFPMCNWLFKVAVITDNVDNLEQVLNNIQDKSYSHTQLLNSIKEYKGSLSERRYRHNSYIPTERLDVLFCINNSYFDGFIATISSFITNNKNILPSIKFHIGIDNSLPEERVTSFLNKIPIDISYTVKNLDSMFNTNNLKVDYGVKTHYVLDRSAYYRIFMIQEMVKNNEIERILYLDSDILVLSNLYNLTVLPLDKPLMATIEDQKSHAVVKSKELNGIQSYFNSGVLLVNAKHKDIYDNIDMSVKASHVQENLIMHDQCALNIGFNKNYQQLDQQYNFLIHQNKLKITDPNISILHLSGRIKPWHHDYHDNEFISKMWHTYHNLYLMPEKT